MKKYLLILLSLVIGGSAEAQVAQDYFFKNWDLSYISPAALAQPGGLSGNLFYSRDNIGNVNTNLSGLFQLHTDINGKHGMGITMQNQKAGILNSTGVGAGYAYSIQLGEKQSLALGSRFNYSKFSIDRGGVMHANTSDPVLYGDAYRQNNILVSTGILYQVKGLQVALNAPDFLPVESANYQKRNFSGYTGYTFDMGTWQLRPNFYYENFATLGDWYEMSLYSTFMKVGTVEVSYTSESALRARIGANYRTFNLGYGYDAGKSAEEAGMSKIGHRVYLAYNFGNVWKKGSK